MSNKLNKYSSRITQAKTQGSSQAMLYATGMTEDDMNKAQVGIASCWYEGNCCNMHLNDLSARVKEGVNDAGLYGMRFNTVGVSDGISMGTDGMNYSLPSREVIADSIETVMAAHWYDANISLPGCDKNMPGCIIAMGRLNRPSIMIYGGTIKPGSTTLKGEDRVLDVVCALEAYGEVMAGKITEEERLDIIRKSCPGAGACGGMYTANTMASAIEAMGMSLPYSASTPAEDPEKLDECYRSGAAIYKLMEKDIKPRDIMTRAAFENAMVVGMAMGGSTNLVLHLIAMAKSMDIKLTLDDFHSVQQRTPLLGNLRPSGKYVMEEVHKVGGVPAVMKYLLEHNMLDGSCMTVTGKTLAENMSEVKSLAEGQDVITSLDNPIKKTGHISILRGNLAPEGAVGKITGKQGLKFTGPARVYDSEEDMLAGLEDNKIKRGDVIIIRYEGPKGGPGMPEMLTPTSALVGAGFIDDVALITDGRFSGGSHGFIVGHVVPEAQEGGPIALVQNGDRITIDDNTGEITVDLSDEELIKRRGAWIQPAYKADRGTLYKFIKNVQTASQGCVTDR